MISQHTLVELPPVLLKQGPRTTVHLFETKELREAGAMRSPQETPKLVSSIKTLGHDRNYLLSKLILPVNPIELHVRVVDGNSSDIYLSST